MRPAPEYVAARAVLLDALEVLEPHADNLVLVGAQAVYLHTGSGDLTQPPMTTDADLALNTADLSSSPEISAAMTAAGFTLRGNPGNWRAPNDIAVDIMVVPHQSGTTRPTARAARLQDHNRMAARITAGLEPALVDNTVRVIDALAAGDPRTFSLKVAGPAALLIAKAIKVDERIDDEDRGQRGRLKDKDALDMFRLLQAVETDALVDGIRLHLADDHARPETERGLKTLEVHAANHTSRLPTLAASASADPVVAPSFAALAHDLLDALA